MVDEDKKVNLFEVDPEKLEEFKEKMKKFQSETGHGLKAFVMGATIGESARKEAISQDDTPANELMAFEAGLVFERVLGPQIREYALEQVRAVLVANKAPEWALTLVEELLKAFLNPRK